MVWFKSKSKEKDIVVACVICGDKFVTKKRGHCSRGRTQTRQTCSVPCRKIWTSQYQKRMRRKNEKS